MKVFIHSANELEERFIDYKEEKVLKKYKYEVDEENDLACIEINTIEELFQLSKELDYRLVINGDSEEIIIYDNWLE